MNKFFILIVTVLAVSGCAKGKDPRTFKSVNPAFKAQVDLFETLYGHRIGDIGIGFQRQDLPTIGVCRVWDTGDKEILIDPVYWQSSDDTERAALILHELGHCALGRRHTEEISYYDGESIKGLMPISLMYPANFLNDGLKEMESYYFYELFNPQEVVPNKNTKLNVQGKGTVCDIVN